MRKNLLSLSIAAMIGGLGLVGTASAGVSIPGTGPVSANVATATNAAFLETTPDGIGHILLVPYFTTQNGNSTLLSIVNTDPTNGKAVKVRFRGAANSDDIFDFQIYMSPGDVWTGNVSQGSDGRSVLYTEDASCTLPSRGLTTKQLAVAGAVQVAGSLNGTPFVTDRLPASFTAAQKAEWTREGYVEIFNMADIPPLTATTSLSFQTTHAAGVAPGCTAGVSNGTSFSSLTTDPADESAARAKGFDTPSGTLFANSTIINVSGASVAWSSEAVAVIGKATAGAVPDTSVRGRIVFSPQLPDVVAGNVINNLTADPLLRNNDSTSTILKSVVAAAMYDLPDLSTPYVGTAALSKQLPVTQANALTTALAVKSVSNEYLTNTAISADTDWTFSMPTRRYSVGMDYNTATAPRAYFNTTTTTAVSATAVGGTDVTTVATFFDANNTTRSGNLLCVNPGPTGTSVTYWNQEEQKPTAGFVISPGTATSVKFCGEASVLAFKPGTVSGVLGATIAANFPATTLTYPDGWLSVPTPGNTNQGLPIIGASYQKASGPAVAGKSTNFGITYGHRTTR